MHLVAHEVCELGHVRQVLRTIGIRVSIVEPRSGPCTTGRPSPPAATARLQVSERVRVCGGGLCLRCGRCSPQQLAPHFCQALQRNSNPCKMCAPAGRRSLEHLRWQRAPLSRFTDFCMISMSALPSSYSRQCCCSCAGLSCLTQSSYGKTYMYAALRDGSMVDYKSSQRAG